MKMSPKIAKIFILLGAIIMLAYGTVLLLFIGSASPMLAEIAPRPLEAWRFVEEKDIEIADHSQAFRRANISVYEGSKTCIKCHEDDTKDLAHSIHYRMVSNARDTSYGGLLVGSRFLYNDFCGAIFWNGTVPINFIGKAVLKKAPPGKEELRGRLIATGCSMCHGVSLGSVPSIKPTKKDLENIDCLVCHHLEYKGGFIGVKEGWRIVAKTETGWRYVPAPNMSAIELAKNIVAKPPKENCLWCHAFSGGGPHFKRPNLSPDLLGSVSEEYDVHMARGLHCTDCHRFEKHRIDTSGALDTWSREDPGETLSCSHCHPEKERHRAPIAGLLIEAFHERVACQTCHVPYIAHGKYPTDLHRDWSRIEFNHRLGRWEPIIETGKNILPVYRWWDSSNREVYIYPEPIEPVNNTIYLVKPVGSIDTPNAKIYPFKLHEAIVPYDSKRKIPLPIKVGIVFATGDIDKAIRAAVADTGLKLGANYTFIKLVRYMSINHGVVPKENSLRCIECHSPWGRMPWSMLGYGPLPALIYIATPIIFALGLLLLIIGLRIVRRL